MDSTARPQPQPLPGNIRCVQPGGGWIVHLELVWGRVRRTLLKVLFPGYVRRSKQLFVGDPTTCPIEVIDSRDLKYFLNVTTCRMPAEHDRYRWRDRLPFARWGLAELLLLGIVPAAIGVALLIWPIGSPYWGSVPLLWAAFVFYFFRDPERPIPSEPGVIVSPADGKIVAIDDIDDAYVGPAVKVGIFLSVFNVHINRSSLAGEVISLDYKPGKFLNALLARSAEENERLELKLVEPAPGQRRFIIRQIAGAIARRIVCQCKPGDILQRGERFGMIKFGSRTELIIPRADLQLAIKKGQTVRGGASVIGQYGSTS